LPQPPPSSTGAWLSKPLSCWQAQASPGKRIGEIAASTSQRTALESIEDQNEFYAPKIPDSMAI